MDAFDKWQVAVTSASVVVPWFLPDIAAHWKVVIVLTVLLVSCFLYCLRLHKRLANVSNERDEASSKHKALAKRFDARRSEIRRYRSCIESTEYLIASTVQSTRQERLVVLYESFLKIKSGLNSMDVEGE